MGAVPKINRFVAIKKNIESHYFDSQMIVTAKQLIVENSAHCDF